MPKIDSSDGVSVRAMARRAISFEEMLAIFGFAANMDLLGYQQRTYCKSQDTSL